MKSALTHTRNFFVEQKYRFDLGTQFLVYVNFSLLIITASDKIKSIIPFRIHELLIILVPLAFIGTWIFGYFLDRVVKYPQTQSRTAEKRSPIWKDTHTKLDRIIELMEEEKKV